MKKKLIRYLILVFGIYLVVFLSRDLFQLLKKKERIKKMEEKIETLRLGNEELGERLEYVESDQFIEKEARDKLNMAKEGETIVILPETLKLRGQESETSPEENLPNWQQWLRLFL